MTLLVLFFVVALYLLVTTPFYILGKRRDVAHPWAAFVPIFGVAIVLFQSIGHSGWLSLMLLVPTLGPLVFVIWTAFAAPPHHGRTRWWTLALLVPVVSLFGWWAYALTLPDEDEEFAFA